VVADAQGARPKPERLRQAAHRHSHERRFHFILKKFSIF
jgi:hypothetical protein